MQRLYDWCRGKKNEERLLTQEAKDPSLDESIQLLDSAISSYNKRMLIGWGSVFVMGFAAGAYTVVSIYNKYTAADQFDTYQLPGRTVIGINSTCGYLYPDATTCGAYSNDGNEPVINGFCKSLLNKICSVENWQHVALAATSLVGMSFSTARLATKTTPLSEIADAKYNVIRDTLRAYQMSDKFPSCEDLKNALVEKKASLSAGISMPRLEVRTPLASFALHGQQPGAARLEQEQAAAAAAQAQNDQPLVADRDPAAGLGFGSV